MRARSSSVLLGACLGLTLTTAGSSARAGWENQSVKANVDSTYLAIGAIDRNRATVVGMQSAGEDIPTPTAMYTKDGGATWNPAVVTVIPSAILMVDETLAFLAPVTALPAPEQSRTQYLHRSTDGGRMFSPIEDAQITKSPLLDPEMIDTIMASDDGQDIWALGESGRILVSRDRGETWEKFRLWKDKLGGQKLSSPSSFGPMLTTGDIVGDSVFLAGGDDGELPVEGNTPSESDPGYDGGYGFVAYSPDRGQTFEILAQGLSFHILDITFIDELRGWAAGGTMRNGGAVLAYTEDGGRTWTEVTPPALPDDEVISGPQFLYPVSLDPQLSYCSRVEFFGPNDGLAMCTNVYKYPGFNGLYRTEDGGRTWEHLPSFNKGYGPAMRLEPSAASATVKDAAFLDCNTVWAAGTNLLIHRYEADDPLNCEAEPGHTGEGEAEGNSDTDSESADVGRVDADCGCAILGQSPVSASLLHLLISL